MSDTYVVAMEGIGATTTLDTMKESSLRAAMRAVNYAAGKAQTRGRKKVAAQVKQLPYSYLAGMDGSGKPRLGITKKASMDDLEAVITGRHRPTSLARAVTAGQPATRGKSATPVTLQVRPGLAVRSKRMFLIRLPAGRTLTETKANMGLAIRLRPGETIEGKHTMVAASRGVYLLFGASVDQVYASVASEDTADVSADLEREFLRLMKLGDF